MKYLLHIDTSADNCNIAIGGDGKVLSYKLSEEARNHAGTINILIDEALEEAKIAMNDLDAVAVCAGPGSYTGLRIGMGTAKGICYALNKPLILDSRLTLLSYHAWLQHPMHDQYISLLTARDKEYFISIHNKEFDCILPPQHVIENDLHDIINTKKTTFVTTDASTDIINYFKINGFQVNTSILLDIPSWILRGFQQYNCNAFVNLRDAIPFYLKQVYTHNKL